MLFENSKLYKKIRNLFLCVNAQEGASVKDILKFQRMTDISKRREDGEMEVDEKDDDDTCMDVENGLKGGEKIRGENNCFAYLRNESSAVDFFFNVVPSSTKEEVHKYLGKFRV